MVLLQKVEDRLIFHKVKAYKKLCQLFGPPCRTNTTYNVEFSNINTITLLSAIEIVDNVDRFLAVAWNKCKQTAKYQHKVLK